MTSAQNREFLANYREEYLSPLLSIFLISPRWTLPTLSSPQGDINLRRFHVDIILSMWNCPWCHSFLASLAHKHALFLPPCGMPFECHVLSLTLFSAQCVKFQFPLVIFSNPIFITLPPHNPNILTCEFICVYWWGNHFVSSSISFLCWIMHTFRFPKF